MRDTTKILTLILILGYNSAYGQKIDTFNVYYQALKLHLDYWDDFQKNKSNLAQVSDTFFIEKNEHMTESMPQKINGYTIEVLNQIDLLEKTKKKTISLIVIRPAVWDNENQRLVIHVIDFKVSRKRKKYSYTNKGGSSFELFGKENGTIGLRSLHQGGI